jgi:hypothetical protein
MGMLSKVCMWDFQHNEQGKYKKIKALFTLLQHHQLPLGFLLPWLAYPLYEVASKVQWSK